MKKQRKQCIIYCRVSYLQKGNHGFNTQTFKIQQKICEDFAIKNNIKIIKIFKDKNSSGSTENRPALIAMLSFLKKSKKNNYLLVYRLDRLARKMRIQETLTKKFSDLGLTGIAVKDNELEFTSKDPSIIMNRQQLSMYAEFELNTTTSRLKDGRAYKQSKGGYAGGGCALGYKAVNGELKINPKTVKTIKTIFYLKRCKQMSLSGIARKFNNEGVKTERGGKWYAGTIRYIIKNKRYTGISLYNNAVKNNNLKII